MDEVIVVKKGYTISVTSWENDGDNYNTKTMTVDDKEYALAILQMCKDIFVSCNNGDGGIGNANGGKGEAKAADLIKEYASDKPLINKGETDPDTIYDLVMDLNYELMGSSEFYHSRVFESGFITYSPVDVKVEQIAHSKEI